MKSQYLKNFKLNITVLYRKNESNVYNVKYKHMKNV